MSVDNVEQRVQGVLADVFGLDPDTVGPGTSIETVEAWDSLGHTELMLAIEERLELEIGPEPIVELTSVPALESFVADYANGGARATTDASEA